MNRTMLGRLTLAALVAMPGTSFAERPAVSGEPAGVERDDPNARHKGLQRIFETPVTPGFSRHMNEAAAKERAKFQGAAFGTTEETAAVAGEPTATLAATTPGVWTNIGPTRSDYIQNGSYTLNQIDSGRVVEIVPDPSNALTVYVAMSGGGVWKTTDGGTIWVPKSESLGSLSTGALEMDPNSGQSGVLYLGLGDSFDGTGIGLVKSTNGGDTWGNPVYLNVSPEVKSTIITKIQVSRLSSSIVLATTDKGLFRSVDAGASWAAQTIATGFADVPYAWDLVEAGNGNWVLSLEATPAATSGTTNGQIWRSNNDGVTWTRSSGVTKTTGVGRISLASANTVVYAMAAIPNASSSTDLADFFRSTDGGTSFVALGATSNKVRYTNSNTESTAPKTVLNGQGWYNHMLAVNPNDSNTFYFGGALLMGKATNSGGWKYTQLTNWLAQFSLPYVHADFHAAAFGADGTFYVGSDGGIFKQAPGTTTWTDLNAGITSHLLYSVGSSPAVPNAVIGGLQDNGTRVRSGGATGTYNQELGGDGFGSHIHPVSGGTMLGTLYYTRIYKSTDGGLNFASANSGIAESNNSGTAPFNTKLTPWTGDASGNTIYTHTNSKVYRSTNYAGSWAQVGALFGSGIYLRNVGVAHTNSNYIGAVASGGRTYLSSNGGASWGNPLSLPNNGFSMNSVAFDRPADPAQAPTVYVSSVAPDAGKTHLWRSDTFGASWTAIDGGGLPAGVPVNTVTVDPANNSVIYAATHLGVYRSADRGATWARFGGTSMPLVNVMDLYVSSTVVRAATFGRGFWEMLP